MSPTKQDIVSRTMSTVMHILHDSQLYGSRLWPRHGFQIGHNTEKLDIITIGIRIVEDSEYKKVRFNIWNKGDARTLKQQKQLVLIFDQCYYDGIFFYPEYPDHTDRLAAHYHDDCVMGMIDFKFNIEN